MRNKLRSFYLFLLVAIIFQACSTDTSKLQKSNVTKLVYPNHKFRTFLNKFKLLNLPFTLILGETNLALERKLNANDNLFIKYKETGDIYAYGMLPDTMDTFKIIWLQPADDYIPILTTFTRSGKKINSEFIGVGGCGVDCCFSCNEHITVKQDLSIFAVDSIKTCECDSSGPKENTTIKYIVYKKGRILVGGKIRMSNEQQKSIKY